MSSNSLPSETIRGVSAIVWHRARVLLVQRLNPPYRGIWALPGGRIEPGETPEAAVVREVHEETGIVVGDPVAVDLVEFPDPADGLRRFSLTVFRARFVSGLPAAGDDASEARWLGPAQLGQLQATEQTLAMIARHAEEHVDA